MLYLAVRNILVDQSIQQDFVLLEKLNHKINVAKDDPTALISNEVYISIKLSLLKEKEKLLKELREMNC